MIVHVEVLEEGSPVTMKVPATDVGDGLYLLGTPDQYDPEDTKLRFLPGQRVRCVSEKFADGTEGLIASELA